MDTIYTINDFTQGFNTGIALYDLDKMRMSDEYEKETNVARMAELAQKYGMMGSVGDQDWLTVLGWEKPHLFYLLPCQFNVQVYDDTF